MLLTKVATIHVDRLRVRLQVPINMGPVPEPSALIYVWCNDFRERVSGPIQPRFDGAKITLGDLGNLFVRLAFQLPEDENISVMLGKLRNALFHDLSQMTLAIHVIRTRARIFELKRPIFILRVLLNSLEKNQRVA